MILIKDADYYWSLVLMILMNDSDYCWRLVSMIVINDTDYYWRLVLMILIKLTINKTQRQVLLSVSDDGTMRAWKNLGL